MRISSAHSAEGRISWGDGHMDPQELSCTTTPECGLGAPGGVSCADLGYPAHFVCDQNVRCVAQP